MLPKNLLQCEEVRKELLDIKTSHQYAINFKDSPAVTWLEPVSGAAFIAAFIVTCCLIPQFADGFTRALVTIFAGCVAGGVTAALTYKIIRVKTKLRPTWKTLLENQLATYTPIDHDSFKHLQQSAKNKEAIDVQDFNSWVKSEEIALKNHVDNLVYQASNVDISLNGPFLSRRIEQD
jgi:hypothetical protein